ncbi:MAG: SpoIID/LytB domain-containing protein [Nitrospirota bacterium]
MSRRAILIGIVLLAGPWPSLAQAQPIRVALLEEAKSVTISGRGPLVVSDGGGRRLFTLKQSKLTIAHARSGMVVNGKAMAQQSLRVAAEQLSVNKTRVHGKLVVHRQPAGLLIVNELELESYVRGVVPAEMPADWPTEALKAQAIAARTYALYQRQRRKNYPFDVQASVLHQAYGGVNGEDGRASRAADATKGEILVHEHEPILALYHANSAGATEAYRDVWGEELSYLQSVACPVNTSAPSADWQRMISAELFEQELRRAGYAVGTVATILPWRRSPSGRVRAVRVIHSGGDLALNGEALRRIMGYKFLPSTMFTVAWTGQTLQWTGRGAGHGVGLCQWGAKIQAEAGWSYRAILSHYYPGALLRRLGQ